MQVSNFQCQDETTHSTIEWRRPDKVSKTDRVFRACQGKAIHKRCHVNSNRDVNCRVMRDGSVKQGKAHKRPTANDMTKFEKKMMRQDIIVIRERVSPELLELARKKSARFDRY